MAEPSLAVIGAGPAGLAATLAAAARGIRVTLIDSAAEAVRELGAGDLRTVKLLTRAGMGWCQGRMCEPGVAGVAGCAETAGRRPFARPVPLGVLARAGETEEQ